MKRKAKRPSSRPATSKSQNSRLSLFSLMALPAAVADGLANALQGLLFYPRRPTAGESDAEDDEASSPSPAFGGCDLMERYDYVPDRPFAYPLADEGVLSHDRNRHQARPRGD